MSAPDKARPTTSAELAKRILAREGVPSEALDSQTTAAALQRVCTRVTDNLRESVGDDGTTALLVRALARTEPHHPVLSAIRHLNGRGITLARVDEGIQSHGVGATTAGIEALLTALFDVLERLIGDDMATRVIDPRGASSKPPTGTKPS